MYQLHMFLAQLYMYLMLMSVGKHAHRVDNCQYCICIDFIQLLHALLMWNQYYQNEYYL